MRLIGSFSPPVLRRAASTALTALVLCANIGSFAPTVEAAGGGASNAASVSVQDLYRGLRPSVVQVRGNLGSGSAFRVREGFVTNAHVAENESELWLYSSDGRRAPAHIVSLDPQRDLTLLQSDLDVPSLELETSDQVAIGAPVLALGYPTGLHSTDPVLTEGIVSAIVQEPASNRVLVRTDTAITYGNSGGALVDATTGKVIGVPTFFVDGADGANFAVASDTVAAFVAAPAQPAPALYRGDALAISPHAEQLPGDGWKLVGETGSNAEYKAMFLSEPEAAVDDDQAAAGTRSSNTRHLMIQVGVARNATAAGYSFSSAFEGAHMHVIDPPTGIDEAASCEFDDDNGHSVAYAYRIANVLVVVLEAPTDKPSQDIANSVARAIAARVHALAN